jgi:hypothetical protein
MYLKATKEQKIPKANAATPPMMINQKGTKNKESIGKDNSESKNLERPLEKP